MSNTKRCKHSSQNRQAKQQDKQEKQGEWLVRSNNNKIHDEEEKGREQCRDSLDEKRKGHLMSRRRRVAAIKPVQRAQNNRHTQQATAHKVPLSFSHRQARILTLWERKKWGDRDREGVAATHPPGERKESQKREREGKGGLEAIKQRRVKQATRSASSNEGRPASEAHRLQPLSMASRGQDGGP